MKDQNSEQRQTINLAIVGIGCMFPQAEEATKFWTNIKTGIDAITPVPETHWRAEDYYDPDPGAADKVYARMGGFLSPVEFNPMDYGILPNAIEAIDTSQLLGLLAVEQALMDAGYGPERTYDRDRVSVILGVTGTLELVLPLGARLGYPRWKDALRDAGIDDQLAADVVKRISDSYVPWQENSFPGLLGNVVAGRISKHFNFGGTNCVVDAACGSSLSAINHAALELAAGRCDMAISGGIDTFNDIFMYTCFSKTPALSPSGHARPYAADADGTTLGEGLGIVVLKRLADAERDGDKIYAVLKGMGSSSDGRGAAIYEPAAAGQAKALRRAYDEAGVTPDTIELIEGHGTGTKVGDAVEVKALHEVFGPADKPWCALGSIKSQIGHTKAAAGSAGLIKAALALYHKVLPPTIKVDKPQDILLEGTTPFYVNTATRPWLSHTGHPRRAGISALGFGGSNFHCLLEEHQPDKKQIDWYPGVQIIPFSASDQAGLRQQLRDFPQTGSWTRLRQAAAERRQAFSALAECRLILVLEQGQNDPATQLGKALTMLDQQLDKEVWDTPDGIYYASGHISGDVALLFPGQGAQYPGMLKDLALSFPEFLATLEDADGNFARTAGLAEGYLAERIYPPPAFDAVSSERAELQLRATEIAQPALGAVSLAAARVLARFGFNAAATAGHSYGELVALCAAEVFGTAELYRLSRLRGELMAAGEGDRGSMLAVSAPLAQIEEFLATESLDLVLANRNTPTQGVLSGPSEEIKRAAAGLTARGISCKQLDVAAAFHSQLVAAAAQPFAAELEQIQFKPRRKPVYSNTSAELYPETADGARQQLAQQLAAPVDFVSEIESLYQGGRRIFVEVGPGARLTGMVNAILTGRNFQALALDSSAGRRSAMVDLARLLAKLSVLGQQLDLAAWDPVHIAEEARDQRKKPAIKVALCGANSYQRPAKRPPIKRAVPVAPQAPVSRETTAEEIVQGQQQPGPVITPGQRNLEQALNLTQQGLQALQKLQEQTAKLHQQFLQGQQDATRSFMALIQQQLPGVLSASDNSLQDALKADQVVVSDTESIDVPKPRTEASGGFQPESRQLLESAPVSQDHSAILFSIIAEKTGYPMEMLELDMSLDSDLGIDSIKRVEILSALQEQLPEAPAIRPEDLGALQTLGQIVEHLGHSSAQVAVGTAAGPANAALNQDAVRQALLEVIAEKTGYPMEMLELDMSLDSDLGIDSIKRVEILSALQEQLPEAPAIRPEDLGALQTLGQIVEHLGRSSAQVAVGTAAGPANAALNQDAVRQALLEVIAEKTGYPMEMLELDMSLDSDLGIDSIKRVEILSALQEQLPGAPAIRPEDLGALQTLGQIVEHLAGCARTLISTTSPSPQLGQLEHSQVAATLLEVIAEKTGYPMEMLELDMSLDSDLGIDSIKRVEILSALQDRLPGAPAIKPDHLGTLQTVAQIVDFLSSSKGSTPSVQGGNQQQSGVAKGIERRILQLKKIPSRRPLAELRFAPGSQVWITDDGSALTDAVCAELSDRGLLPVKLKPADMVTAEMPPLLVGLIIAAPLKGTDDQFLQQAFQLVRKAGAELGRAAVQGGAFLATVSRLNGFFGLAGQPDTQLTDPLSGGLAGLCKTAALEWPAVHCKALDLAMGLEIKPTAATLVEEIFFQAPLEVGIASTGLVSLDLVSQDLPQQGRDLPVSEGDLIVISGGARGVTAEVAVTLAENSGATLLLLGRSEPADEEPAWLKQLTTDAEIKQGLLRQNPSLKPRDLERSFQHLRATREIRSTLERILKAGGRPLYRSVDLRDSAAVTAVIDEARRRFGPVTGLIHGAGVLADKLIRDKTDSQFELVYSTKVQGLRTLLQALEQDPLKFMAFFSSSSGRFGRSGQVDYAMANEILNKYAQLQARLRPDCRVAAVNWGPWNGGMVTPALKKVFAQEGLDVIDLKAGADYLLGEISQPPETEVEMVVLGGEDRLEKEGHSHHNIHVSKAFDLELAVDQYPFLKSHVLNGKAVLPMAIIVEWLAHGAMHNNPGLKFQGFNDLRILKGVTLDARETLELQIMTGKAIKSDGVHMVPVELSSVDSGGHQIVHARGRMVLAGRAAEAKSPPIWLPLAAYPHDRHEAYSSSKLFHGEMFQGLRELIGYGDEGISAMTATAAEPRHWIQSPLRSSWLADPLVLDSSFQLLILWGFEQYQSASLPVFAERYRQFRERFPEAVEIRARILEQNPKRARANIDFIDPADGQLIARMENYECVIDASLNRSFERNRLIGVA